MDMPDKNIVASGFDFNEYLQSDMVAEFNDYVAACGSVPQFEWPECETGYIKVDGGKIFYQLFGKDKPGIPLILCHGGPGGNFARYFTLLHFAKERPVLMWTQLGSAGTVYDVPNISLDEASKYMTLDALVEQLHLVVKHFSFKKYFLLGHSCGGMLVTAFAGKYNPKELIGLIDSGPYIVGDLWRQKSKELVETLPDGKQKWAKAQVLFNEFRDDPDAAYNNEFINELNDEYTDNFGTRSLARKPQTPNVPDAPVIVNKQGKQIDRSVYRYMWGPNEFLCSGNIGNIDLRSQVAAIDAPFLFILGEYCNAGVEACAEYAEIAKDGRLAVINNAGHSCYFDQTKQYTAHLRKFLDYCE